MAVKFSSSSLFCVADYLSAPFNARMSSKMTLSRRPYDRHRCDVLQLEYSKVKSFHFVHGPLKLQGSNQKRPNVLFAISEDQSEYVKFDPDALEHEFDPDALEQVSQHPTLEGTSQDDSPCIHNERNNGKPGLISFYNRPYKREDDISITTVQKSWSSLVWLVGPCVLVASFIFPSLYLRKIISMVFEDSLLTDFLILFFTEALFYGGVAVFLLLIDRLRRPIMPYSATKEIRSLHPQLGQQISSVATLVLSLIIPMVTMGLVWPWTGPAASATLAPYLVGIVVQFAFEQYARYRKSPSWPVIPIIFQVYRLHQLNRAAQLVTALSFTVRGAEVTSHNLAINKSLGALLNVLQLLGVICIWSLSSFLMRFFPPTAASTE